MAGKAKMFTHPVLREGVIELGAGLGEIAKEISLLA